MKQAFKSVRGTLDLFPAELLKRRHIEQEMRAAVELFGYKEIETPILEQSSLFERSLGTDSEVVSKEMFRLQTRGDQQGPEDESIVLRPENTAAVLRAVLNSGQQYQLPLHYYYCGPQFRYERPQKGRVRQFHQFGVECIGRSSPLADAECILSAAESLRSIGALQHTKLKINTLGQSEESRAKYNHALRSHLLNWQQTKELSPDTVKRIAEGRVLRALDSKSPLDQECISQAPSLLEFLPQIDLDRFNIVVRILKEDYHLPNVEIDPRLVRGLDYYSHTCFEFVSSHSDTSFTVMAGGRYDGLARAFGYTKSQIPAIGWAAGLERLVLHTHMKEFVHEGVRLMIVPRLEGDIEKDEKVMSEVANFATRARRKGVSCRVWDSEVGTSVKKALKEADMCKVRHVCFLGSHEILSGRIPVRLVATGEVKEMKIESILDDLMFH